MIAAQTVGGRPAAWAGRVSYGIRRLPTSTVHRRACPGVVLPMSSALRVALAGLVAASLAACASAPAATPDLTPPPRRPVDAKTQLEYGNPPPPPPGRY